jgi:hypothetical protein
MKFTCPDALAVSHLIKAANGPRQVANDAEQRKSYKYAVLSIDNQFVPIAMETLGPVGDAAEAFYHELGRRIRAIIQENRALCRFYGRS